MKYDAVKPISAAVVIGLHDDSILRYGGSDGISNLGALESAVMQPLQAFGGVVLYDSFAKMGAALAFGIAKNHAFLDGNKRAAVLAAGAFLELNGKRMNLGPEWIERMVQIADDKATREDLVRWFAEALGDDDEPVEL